MSRQAASCAWVSTFSASRRVPGNRRILAATSRSSAVERPRASTLTTSASSISGSNEAS
jgi:hypothetical protein